MKVTRSIAALTLTAHGVASQGSHYTRHVRAADELTRDGTATRAVGKGGGLTPLEVRLGSAPPTTSNSRVLRNLTLFDGEALHPLPQTVVIKDGVVTAVLPSSADRELVDEHERLGIVVQDKAGRFALPALQDGEFHFHTPDQFLSEWTNIPPSEDQPVKDDAGRVVRPPMGKLYRKLVDRGLMKTIVPFDFPYGNVAGTAQNTPHPLNDMVTSMNFGVFTVHDMQSNPGLTRMFVRARAAKLEGSPPKQSGTPEERMLTAFAKNTPRFNTSGNWLIAGDMQYYPKWGTEGFYNLKDGWTKEDIARAIERRKTYHGATYIKVYYDDQRRRGAEQPKDRPAIDKETLAEIVVASHARGLPVVVHARTVSEAVEALERGADCLIHTPGDAEVNERLIELARAHGSPLRLHPERAASMVPSLTVLLAQIPRASRDPFVSRYVGQHWSWTADPAIADEVDTYVSPYDTLRLLANSPATPGADHALLFRNVAKLHAAGVRLIAGVDASGAEPAVPGLTVHYEMALIRAALMEAGGLSAREASLEALKSATLNPTRMFAGDDAKKEGVPYGLVRPGFAADLLLLADNPATGDFKSTVRIRDMYRAGYPVERRVLRQRPLAARKLANAMMTP
ncbi:MAG: amidohydrolase family protein [Myxococcota bacterium]|nr:amidohydrolase family protein [Myxococcota bacterium]